MSKELGYIENPKGRVSKDLRVHHREGTQICYVCCGSGMIGQRECRTCSGFGKMKSVPR